MNSWRVVCSVVVLLCCLPAAYAQSHELWVSGGYSEFGFPYSNTNRNLGSPAASGNSNDVQIGNGWRVGVRLALNTAGSFGHEFQYAYNRPDLRDGTGLLLGAAGPARMQLQQVGYNFLYYFTSAEAVVRPLATVGVHASDFVLSGADLSSDHSWKFGVNYGVGLKVRMSSIFGLRLDLRGYETGKPNWNSLLFKNSGLLSQAEASAGLGVYF
jgi:opacity protein-like surface antigen